MLYLKAWKKIWAGDYADHEENEENNLYYLMDNYNNKYFEPIMHSNDMNNYKYIVNHTKKMYVIKKINDTDNNIHPLPLLVLDKYNNDDYFGNNNELCGTWAKDIISIEENIPEDYNELEYDFYEYY